MEPRRRRPGKGNDVHRHEAREKNHSHVPKTPQLRSRQPIHHRCGRRAPRHRRRPLGHGLPRQTDRREGTGTHRLRQPPEGHQLPYRPCRAKRRYDRLQDTGRIVLPRRRGQGRLAESHELSQTGGAGRGFDLAKACRDHVLRGDQRHRARLPAGFHVFQNGGRAQRRHLPIHAGEAVLPG